MIDDHNAGLVTKIEQNLFAQRQRLTKAERALQTKPTRKASDDQRTATNKIDRAKHQLADLRRKDSKPRGSRIFSDWYTPVMMVENSKRILKPMRYQCRPAGKPATYDRKYPGTYNARHDNLEGFWKGQFGHTHGLMVVDRFYENVEGPNGANQVLEVVPKTREVMLVACLWSHWTDPKGIAPDLPSFPAITDELELEVAAAGHDRTIINIKPEHIDAWLSPGADDLAAMYAIFDDKRNPYYEHLKAA